MSPRNFSSLLKYYILPPWPTISYNPVFPATLLAGGFCAHSSPDRRDLLAFVVGACR